MKIGAGIAVCLAVALSSYGCSSKKGGDSSSSAAATKETARGSGSTKASTPPPSATPSAGGPVTIGPPGDSGATIAYNPDGPNPVDDSKLHGDPATCAKVKSCCNNQSGPLALGCQMAISQDNGDCAKILATVKPMAKELGKPPAGCE